MDTGKNELFDARPNEQGKIHLQKFKRNATVAFFFGLFWGIIYCLYYIRVYNKRQTLHFPVSQLKELFLKYVPLVSILLIIMNMVGIFYYYLFANKINRAIELNEEISFNDSFKLIRAYSFIVILIIIPNLMLALFEMILFWKS